MDHPNAVPEGPEHCDRYARAVINIIQTCGAGDGRKETETAYFQLNPSPQAGVTGHAAIWIRFVDNSELFYDDGYFGDGNGEFGWQDVPPYAKDPYHQPPQ